MIGFYHLNKLRSIVYLDRNCLIILYTLWQFQGYLYKNSATYTSTTIHIGVTPLKIYQKELTTVCEKGTLQSLLWSSLFQEFFKGYKLRSKNTTKILEETFPYWSELFIIMLFSVFKPLKSTMKITMNVSFQCHLLSTIISIKYHMVILVITFNLVLKHSIVQKLQS